MRLISHFSMWCHKNCVIEWGVTKHGVLSDFSKFHMKRDVREISGVTQCWKAFLFDVIFEWPHFQREIFQREYWVNPIELASRKPCAICNKRLGLTYRICHPSNTKTCNRCVLFLPWLQTVKFETRNLLTKKLCNLILMPWEIKSYLILQKVHRLQNKLKEDVEKRKEHSLPVPKMDSPRRSGSG